VEIGNINAGGLMEQRIPEMSKKPGIFYAWTDDGYELPVVDYSHPAFEIRISDDELSKLIDAMQRSAAIPQAALQAAAQKSILVRGLVESAGTFTTGMNTYLNKIPAELLGEGYAGMLDRQWAMGLTPLTFRWRMRDVARLLADNLGPVLRSQPGKPLRLVNIAGGPALDSLNALIFLQKEHPQWLAAREIGLLVLDVDLEGPSFGKRALAVLQAEDGPLHGVSVTFQSDVYDWCDPQSLKARLREWIEPGMVAAGSSEGGLFEYASDEVIAANLTVFHKMTPHEFNLVGPVVRDEQSLDPRLRTTEHSPGRPAVRYLGLRAMEMIASNTGWRVERTLDGPMHQVMSLKKA
jgi:hypothetical protein